MNSKVMLEMAKGIKVAVPNSLNLITPYVISEQGDWFEDEIKFVRHVLQPGQQAIDIGANYGLFTLSMAQVVGSTGQIWAFEPATSTANYLTESVISNGFNHVLVDSRGLSSDEGSARLSLNDDAELNEIVRGDIHSGVDTETIQLSSLDLLQREYGWQNIDFVKIDAEGEEAHIIKGGAIFLAQNSPLIQYEIKAGVTLHLDLVDALNDIGYASYRLIPGLNLLVPFSTEEPPDSYLLNLFCCKTDRAAHLAARGLLVRAEDVALRSGETAGKAILSRWNSDGRYNWQEGLGNLPYAHDLLAIWEKTSDQKRNRELDASLGLYFVSQRQDIPAADRFIALRESLKALQMLCATTLHPIRLASLARVSREFGAREMAVRTLHALANELFNRKTIDLSEPFLAVTTRFDAISPGKELGNWLVGSVQEAYEINAYFSSFYAESSGHERLKWIVSLGFASDEIKRRLRLVEQRFRLTPFST